MSKNVHTTGQRRVLRELAYCVSEIASRPIQQERIGLWKAMNALHPIRPLVAIYPERAWSELVSESELVCEDTLLRTWELSLRQTIFHSEHMDDDRPIHGVLMVPWVIDWGTIGVETKTVHADGPGAEAIRWDPPIKTMKDLEKLRFRTLSIDRNETHRRESVAQELFGDIIPVEIYGGLPFWSVGLSQLIQLRGLEQAMIDMYEQPELLHALMRFLRDDRMRVMDVLEKEQVLSVNDKTKIDYFIGSGHEGYTDELPAVDFSGNVRWKDMWGLGEMQEFSGVGPDQFYEFSLQYQVPLLERFGLTSYGCCEPLDRMYGMLKKALPNLRRVSVTSPYADKKTAADSLGTDTVFAWKPNPTPLAMPAVDWDWVEKDMRETIELARGCCLEIVMKSTETFRGDPARVRHWVKLARGLVEN
jgi:hypothetical protein